MSLTLSEAAAVAQILFYAATATVAILTYRSARMGLLNTVNTEYQKRVIDRLDRLAAELLEEFSRDSDHYWAKDDPVSEMMDEIHKEFLENRDQILSTHTPAPVVRVPSHVLRLEEMLNRIQSDPFIPRKIRELTMDLLQQRCSVMDTVYFEEITQYAQELAGGQHLANLDHNKGWLSNKINERLYERGCGLSQVEAEVHKLRLAIQQYFESFNPLG